MSRALRVRNWAKYQHYKDRNPAWIKLHYEILTSRDWVALDDASRVLAVACMLIASRDETHQGVIPADPDYIKRVAYLNKRPDFEPLILCGFLEVASEALADASMLHTNARPETYREETYREEKESISRKARENEWPEDYETIFLDAYPKRVDKGATIRKLRAIYRADKVPWPAVIGAVQRYASDCRTRGTEVQFIKSPLVWLNKGCWDDELPSSPSTFSTEKPKNVGWRPGLRTTEEILAATKFERTDVQDHEPDREEVLPGGNGVHREAS